MLARFILIAATLALVASCALKPRELRRIDYADCRAEAESVSEDQRRDVFASCLGSRGDPTPGS